MRTIPTCVGSTLKPTAAYPENKDHPHVRGEHADLVDQFGGGAPDHPHVRGEHAAERTLRRLPGTHPKPDEKTGTIPTCVGSTKIRQTAQKGDTGTIPTCVGSTEDDLQF